MAWQTKWKQDHNQAIKHRADWFKPFWKTKKGHWKLIYPGIDEIEGLNCRLTVECLDCGAVIMRDAHHWLVDHNRFGCSNCFAQRGVAQKVKMIEAQGFEVVSTKVKGKFRIYTMKCPKCGLVFNQWGNNLGRWMKLGEKANYSESRVRNIANGLAYNEETAKRIAEIAEKMVKGEQ